MTYKDDSVQKGVLVKFETGTHYWAREQLVFTPTKPVQKVFVSYENSITFTRFKCCSPFFYLLTHVNEG